MKILELIRNAKALPNVYYGLHFAEGLAEYRQEGKKPQRILINESVMKSMDPTFAGKPMYVRHVNEVDLPNLQAEADGYVIESFFNRADGKHWAKFIVVSDKGHEAVRRGWRLSNAYHPTSYAGGGQWHGLDYDQEVMAGEYEHMALTDDPRYAESIILTPEQFKAYNHAKEQELVRLANEKGAKPMFKIFNKKEADNSAALLGMSVVLTKSKVEKTLEQILNEADDQAMEMGKPEHMANGAHMVECGGGKMTVNDLVAKHTEMCNELSDLKKKHVDGEGGEGAELSADDKKANEDKMAKEAADKKANEDKMAEDKKQNDLNAAAKKASDDAAELKRFNDLKNAGNKPVVEAVQEFAEDQVARGKRRYGSAS